MKKWFLNLMICLVAIILLASVISVSLALCEWDEKRFWQGIAALLYHFYYLKFLINYKRYDV